MAAYHATGFRQAGAEIIALCDVNQGAAHKAAAKHGIAKVYTDVAEMLKALPELDAVSGETER
jgi:predicted dehydrogenase